MTGAAGPALGHGGVGQSPRKKIVVEWGFNMI